MFKYFRILLNKIVSSRGYELRRSTATPRGYSGFLSYVKEKGFSPATIIDVGVGYGTPWLYTPFPDAKLVLVEPQKIFAKELDSFRQTLKADIHSVGLGSEPGSLDITYPVGVPTSGSVNTFDDSRKELFYSEKDFATETVAIVTLDSLNTYEGPQLLKIDVEGFELEVLKGAQDSLKKTGMIIVEISFLPRFDNDEGCGPVVSYLHSLGWRLVDIAHIEPYGNGGPPAFADFVFVHQSSTFASVPQKVSG